MSTARSARSFTAPPASRGHPGIRSALPTSATSTTEGLPLTCCWSSETMRWSSSKIVTLPRSSVATTSRPRAVVRASREAGGSRLANSLAVRRIATLRDTSSVYSPSGDANCATLGLYASRSRVHCFESTAVCSWRATGAAAAAAAVPLPPSGACSVRLTLWARTFASWASTTCLALDRSSGDTAARSLPFHTPEPTGWT
mmetsp:Transcript_34237/g.89830  ORF Transcript_34237/g.89830 Transcript_34237/m.89830 type:complete len:200 (+) Transcript_34237:127-726(+)